MKRNQFSWISYLVLVFFGLGISKSEAVSSLGITCLSNTTGNSYEINWGGTDNYSLSIEVTCTVHGMSVEHQKVLMDQIYNGTGSTYSDNVTTTASYDVPIPDDHDEYVTAFIVGIYESGSIKCNGTTTYGYVGGDAGSASCTRNQEDSYRGVTWFTLTSSSGGTQLPELDPDQYYNCMNYGECFTEDDTFTFTTQIIGNSIASGGEKVTYTASFPNMRILIL